METHSERANSSLGCFLGRFVKLSLPVECKMKGSPGTQKNALGDTAIFALHHARKLSAYNWECDWSCGVTGISRKRKEFPEGALHFFEK